MCYVIDMSLPLIQDTPDLELLIFLIVWFFINHKNEWTRREIQAKPLTVYTF